MAGYVSVNLSLELTRLIPVRKILNSGTEAIVEFARSLRKSGSDIVVEADMASIFGRSKLTDSVSTDFKTITKVTGVKHLNDDFHLQFGTGPTLIRAYQEPEYLSTVVQISMLSYFCHREVLSEMISDAMSERLMAGIAEAAPSPGVQGITGTVQACREQSASYNWSYYTQLAEVKIRAADPDWEFHQHHLQLSSPLLLAFMDFISVVQSLPEDRSITISNNAGCILAIVWAHYLHGLRVELHLPRGMAVLFGDPGVPQVIIYAYSSELERSVVEKDRWRMFIQPVVQLYQKDLDVVLLECQPTGGGPVGKVVADMHPLSGYGDAYLTRLFNRNFLVKENDAVYDDAVTLTTALALCSIRKLKRRLPARLADSDGSRKAQKSKFAEAHNIADVCKVVFRSRTLSPERINQQANSFMSMQTITPDCLPLSLENNLKRSSLWREMSSSEMLESLIHLACVIVSFAHVVEVSSANADMEDMLSFAQVPVSMDRFVGYPLQERGLVDWQYKIHSDGLLDASDIFHTVCLLLTDGEFDLTKHDRLVGRNKADLCLFSSSGWSIFLNTFQLRDPAKTRVEFIHIQKGVPVCRKTGEQRRSIHDFPYSELSQWSLTETVAAFPISRPLQFRPTQTAEVLEPDLWWGAPAGCFEMTTKVLIRSLLSFDDNSKPHEEVFQLSPRKLSEILWDVELTTSCRSDCPFKAFASKTKPYPEERKIRTGSGVVIVDGWSPDPKFLISAEPIEDRVMILQTRGNTWMRWIALQSCYRHQLSIGHNGLIRRTMLVTQSCCESCALEQVSAQSGNWVVIL